ncbi:MAG: ERCC4 domain-containing protein [Lachnospiraceae bacterium]|nr:ERCC4 domain-containing protein [Lachnospiraceae bacterium]
MDPLEIEATLDTFRIIADTREQNTPKASERFKSFGVPVQRATLRYGDYCANVFLPTGQPLHDASSTISAPCVIERKMSIDELAGCFGRGRDRFRREFQRAKDAGATVYLLIEGCTFEAIINKRYRSRFNPDALLASLMAWAIRYDLRILFCKAGTSGRIIKEILYRDIKERLERGDYG